MPTVVAVDSRACKAHGLPPLSLMPGSVLVASNGLSLRLRPDGGLDVIAAIGWRSIASDPTAVRRWS